MRHPWVQCGTGGNACMVQQMFVRELNLWLRLGQFQKNVEFLLDTLSLKGFQLF